MKKAIAIFTLAMFGASCLATFAEASTINTSRSNIKHGNAIATGGPAKKAIPAPKAAKFRGGGATGPVGIGK